MPLPSPRLPRKRLHQRKVSFEGWQRDDGLIDIEAHITDLRDEDSQLGSGLRRSGEPIHDMWIRVTIDQRFFISEIAVSSDAVPYPGGCEAITPAYQQLVGLNLVKGFRREVTQRLGSIHGCSHITELAFGLPTAAIQTFAGIKNRLNLDPDRKPFQLDSCHALETTTETVRRYYPRWYRGGEATKNLISTTAVSDAQ
ncbi:MAG: DUF2889 domain-containing protein [Rhodocyclaceae bacterium]|nr:DUF2889 domain-containing protein [Rhodocyclaceae bacterium]